MPGVLLCCLACQACRGVPLDGVLLCISVHQSLKGASWVGSCCVVQCLRCLMGQPFIVHLPMLPCGEREAMVMAPPPMRDAAVLPCFHAAQLSPTGISHYSLLPHIPLICLSTVNSSPCPGIAPQSLDSSSQLLAHSRVPASLSGVWMAVARTV